MPQPKKNQYERCPSCDRYSDGITHKENRLLYPGFIWWSKDGGKTWKICPNHPFSAFRHT